MQKEWQKLSGFKHARLRTEMYFGSREAQSRLLVAYRDGVATTANVAWVPALFTAVREILDNALDEVVAHGHGNRISVTFDPATLDVSVADNGRGIPINWDETEQGWAATVLLSETMAGRNFQADRGETRGLNGVGASVVNFCSDSFRVEVVRDGKQFDQTFRGGEELIIEDPLILPTKQKTTGTKIGFRLSAEVFADRTLPESFIADRMYEIALCYPKLAVVYNGQAVSAATAETMFPGRSVIPVEIAAPDFHSRFWLVPEFLPPGQELVHSLVNAIPAFQGGTHTDTFSTLFTSGLLTALERESKRRKLTPIRADISDGLLIYNVTQMAAPQFDGQAKTRLINKEVSGHVRGALTEAFFRKLIGQQPAWIERIYARCAARTDRKDSAAIAKLAKQGKRQRIEDLEDACGLARSKCILFLTEGKSAIAGMIEARDPEIHGGLPLRGKPMNVRGEAIKDIFANETLAKIMHAVGLVPGQRVNRHTLRYGKVYLTTDADEDGKNIAALLVNFFHSLWPDLLDPNKPPFLYVFDTPLIIAIKGKQRRYWYSDTVGQFEPESLKAWEITRAKGLAALRREDWRHVLTNPKLIPIIDDGNLQEVLGLLFDKTAADARKDWIGL